MYIVLGIAFGLIIVNNLVGLHIQSEQYLQAVKEELTIIK